MKLFSIDSATKTAMDGVLVLSLTADIDDGKGTQSGIPYGWHVDLRDPHGLYPQVDAWMAENPDFPIAEYVPPIITPEQVTAEAQRRFMLATADARALNQILGTPIPAEVVALGQAIMTKGGEIAAMTPIPADYYDDKYW